ncbi:MAG: hypothetical protein WD648_05280 [Planctomycetaceae bacterium]
MENSTRKYTKLIAVAVTAVFLIAGIASLHSEDTKAGGKRKADKAASESKDATKKKSGPRLPSNYGKLDLTTKQRDQIYAIQAKSADEIDALRKQLKALEDKRDQEIQTVLTDTQKAKLKELAADSETKRKGVVRKSKGGLSFDVEKLKEQKSTDKQGSEKSTDKKVESK